MLRRTTTVTFLTSVLLLAALPAFACGFLIAENGAVRLVRTSTLVGWVDGVEHYVTAFEFQGPTASFGSIVPLPGEPTTVEKAGSWTLQRLAQETQPQPAVAFEAARADGAGGGVEVLQEVEIDALDITILRGGGAAVVAWAEENGFSLGADLDAAEEMLGFYADRSPYFMAARYDVDRAADQASVPGDGTPVHLAIPTDDPWVPLRILGYDKPAAELVDADVYLLTPDVPTLLPGDRDGVTVEHSEPATSFLLDDLRSDENSGWIPEEAHLTYLRLSIPAGELDFDLAIDVDGDEPDRVAAFGIAARLTDGRADPGALDPIDRQVVALTAVGVIALIGALVAWTRRWDV